MGIALGDRFIPNTLKKLARYKLAISLSLERCIESTRDPASGTLNRPGESGDSVR